MKTEPIPHRFAKVKQSDLRVGDLFINGDVKPHNIVEAFLKGVVDYLSEAQDCPLSDFESDTLVNGNLPDWCAKNHTNKGDTSTHDAPSYDCPVSGGEIKECWYAFIRQTATSLQKDDVAGALDVLGKLGCPEQVFEGDLAYANDRRRWPRWCSLRRAPDTNRDPEYVNDDVTCNNEDDYDVCWCNFINDKSENDESIRTS